MGLDISPEFIAENREGVRVEIEKIGGGIIGKAYAGDWQYRVTVPAWGGFMGNTYDGTDLRTGTPKTHAEACAILCDMFEFLGLDFDEFRQITGRYVVQYEDGIGHGNTPEPPTLANTFDTLKDVRNAFGAWLKDSGNDYVRAEGYGQPSAWVHTFDSWDGISYGDGYPVALFTRGPMGGIVRESV